MDIAGEMVGAIIIFLVLFFIGKNIEVFKSIFAWTLLPGILAVVIVIFFVDDVPYKKTDNKQLKVSKDKKLLKKLEKMYENLSILHKKKISALFDKIRSEVENEK